MFPEGLGENGTTGGVTVVVTDENPYEDATDGLIFVTPFVNVTIHDLFKGKKTGVPITLILPRKKSP
jgi:hypothetical protein